jgi:hypothetical protein
MKAADAAPCKPTSAAFTTGALLTQGLLKRRRSKNPLQLRSAALFRDWFAHDPKETDPTRR